LSIRGEGEEADAVGPGEVKSEEILVGNGYIDVKPARNGLVHEHYGCRPQTASVVLNALAAPGKD
jgi:hypothetical protein